MFENKDADKNDVKKLIAENEELQKMVAEARKQVKENSEDLDEYKKAMREKALKVCKEAGISEEEFAAFEKDCAENS